MESINVSVLYSLLIILVAVCSIAGFLLGRKKEATESGKTQGAIETNLSNMSDNLKKMNESLDRMNIKIDETNANREEDYRKIIINQTELLASYRSLHKRVDFLFDKLRVENVRSD